MEIVSSVVQSPNRVVVNKGMDDSMKKTMNGELLEKKTGDKKDSNKSFKEICYAQSNLSAEVANEISTGTNMTLNSISGVKNTTKDKNELVEDIKGFELVFSNKLNKINPRINNRDVHEFISATS